MRLLQPERRFLFVLAVIAAASVAWAEPGDFDSDGDVDLADFLVFQECFRGSGVAISPPCDAFDLDADGDVDLSDFISVSGRFHASGASTPGRARAERHRSLAEGAVHSRADRGKQPVGRMGSGSAGGEWTGHRRWHDRRVRALYSASGTRGARVSHKGGERSASGSDRPCPRADLR